MTARVLYITLMFLPAFARADDRDDAQRAMVDAQACMVKQDYSCAVENFQRASKIAPASTGPLLGLGLAYQAQSKCTEAIPALERYLQKKGTNPHPSAMAALKTCRAEEANKRRPAHVTLRSIPSGVTVKREDSGASLGVTPVEVELAAGSYRLHFEKSGFVSLSESITVRTSESLIRDVFLQPVADPEALRVAVEEATLKLKEKEASGGRKRRWPIVVGVLGGVAAVGLALGLGFGLTANNTRPEALFGRATAQ